MSMYDLFNRVVNEPTPRTYEQPYTDYRVLDEQGNDNMSRRPGGPIEDEPSGEINLLDAIMSLLGPNEAQAGGLPKMLGPRGGRPAGRSLARGPFSWEREGNRFMDRSLESTKFKPMIDNVRRGGSYNNRYFAKKSGNIGLTDGRRGVYPIEEGTDATLIYHDPGWGEYRLPDGQVVGDSGGKFFDPRPENKLAPWAGQPNPSLGRGPLGYKNADRFLRSRGNADRAPTGSPLDRRISNRQPGSVADADGILAERWRDVPDEAYQGYDNAKYFLDKINEMLGIK